MPAPICGANSVPIAAK
jgi:hypothetical protein